MNARDTISGSKLVVLKIGTALVAQADGAGVKAEWLEALAQDVKALTQAGKKIVIVSSGAVALGRKALGITLNARPSSIPLEKKQAASAVGQYHLFDGYYRAFAKVDVPLAQVLITMSETENRRMNLNARATLTTLLEAGIIPVINENDTISTGEIRFGDNDRLAARVAQMIGADLVILLSTTDGLYTANPDIDPKAEHIALVDRLGDEHAAMAGEAIPGLSTGGMKSKVEAAVSATGAGVSLVIARGTDNHALRAVCDDPSTRSTLFPARESAQSARKKWIGAHLRPKGAIIVDDGAISALKSGKSLLPVGVKSIEGAFERGDVVEIRSLSGVKLGMGITAYNAPDAAKIAGKSSKQIAEIVGYAGRDELVHRNDLALIG
jgi:glutamate 5-kinase